MNNKSLISKDISPKLSGRLVLLCLICYGFFPPLNGWSQSFSDTGSFTFTGSHNPVRSQIFREYLPGDGLRINRVQLHPFLGIAQIFTDNVFKTKTQRRSDFLTTIAPGLQAKLPFGAKHSFLLDYRAAQFLYAKFSENNVYSQNGVGVLSLNFPIGLTIKMQGGHVEGFDPRGSEVDIQDRDITKWGSTGFLASARWNGSKSGVRLRSRFSRLHFRNNRQAPIRDRESFRTDLTGFLKVSPSLSALLGARINDTTYDENTQLNSFGYGVFTGVEISPIRQLSGEVNVGYSIVNFDRAPIAQPSNPNFSRGGVQQQRLTVRGQINWRMSRYRRINTQIFRLIRQSAANNASTFVQTGVSVRVSQNLTERVLVLGNFLYSNSDFQAGRNDHRFRSRMGLQYRTLRWLGFNLYYSFSRRNSNQSRFDFYSNTIGLSAQGLF